MFLSSLYTLVRYKDIGYGLCLQWILQFYGISNCNILDFSLATFVIFILQQIYGKPSVSLLSPKNEGGRYHMKDVYSGSSHMPGRKKGNGGHSDMKFDRPP